MVFKNLFVVSAEGKGGNSPMEVSARESRTGQESACGDP